jgi:hypothetical protein
VLYAHGTLSLGGPVHHQVLTITHMTCTCDVVFSSQVVAGAAPELRLTAQESKVPLERNWEFSAASSGATIGSMLPHHFVTQHCGSVLAGLLAGWMAG